jgi:hypothetical protein
MGRRSRAGLSLGRGAGYLIPMFRDARRRRSVPVARGSWQVVRRDPSMSASCTLSGGIFEGGQEGALA